MTTLLDIAAAVVSAPEDPFDLAACQADPLLCPWCFGSGKPQPSKLHIAAALGQPAPTVCGRCKGNGRRNCERCGVRPWTRSSTTFRGSLCDLCDFDARKGDPCTVCGTTDPEGHSMLHFPCGGLFCSSRCAVDPRHTCEDVDRTIEVGDGEDEAGDDGDEEDDCG